MDSRFGEGPDRRVIEYLRRHCGVTTANSSTPLSELPLDSLDLIECLFELEQYFGKTLSNAELAALMTVADLIAAFGATKVSKEQFRKKNARKN